jgi:release factor glutamine methyltransferase
MTLSPAEARWTRRDLLEIGARELADAQGCARENPRHESALVLQAALRIDRTEFLARSEEPVSEKDTQLFRNMLRERARGVPLPLLSGATDFHDITLEVQNGVFLPRPETELLVEELRREILRRLAEDRGVGAPPFTILDIGTGTGAIAIALASSLKGAPIRVVATDINTAAVGLARRNALRNGVDVEVRHADLFESLSDLAGRVDVLVSNPPYVSPEEGEELPAEVRLGDPPEALFDPEGGTGFHRRVAGQGREHLRAGGLLALEIGEKQGVEIERVLADLGFNEIRIVPDLAGRDRYACGRWRGFGAHAATGETLAPGRNSPGST